MAEHITDTLDIAVITLVRQAFGDEPFDAVGPLDVNEATRRVKRAQRLAQAARLDGPVVSLQVRDLNRMARMLGLPEMESPSPAEAFETAFCGETE